MEGVLRGVFCYLAFHDNKFESFEAYYTFKKITMDKCLLYI